MLFREIRDRVSRIQGRYLDGDLTREDFAWLCEAVIELSLEAEIQMGQRANDVSRHEYLTKKLGADEKSS